MEKSRHEAVWDWLQQCPHIKDMFFNFSDAKNGDTVLVPDAAYSDEFVTEPFIDGSGEKHYDCQLIVYQPFTTTPNSTENIDVLESFEAIAAWIDKAGEKKNYPQFPANSEITDLYPLPTSAGYVAGADNDGAKYMLSFRIEYFYEERT